MGTPFYTDTQQHEVARVIPDLIRSRRLLLDLVWKDLRARYRNAAMGFLWAVLQPLLMMLILWFIFGYVLQFRLGGEGGLGLGFTSGAAGAGPGLSDSIMAGIGGRPGGASPPRALFFSFENESGTKNPRELPQ